MLLEKFFTSTYFGKLLLLFTSGVKELNFMAYIYLSTSQTDKIR